MDLRNRTRLNLVTAFCLALAAPAVRAQSWAGWPSREQLKELSASVGAPDSMSICGAMVVAFPVATTNGLSAYLSAEWKTSTALEVRVWVERAWPGEWVAIRCSNGTWVEHPLVPVPQRGDARTEGWVMLGCTLDLSDRRFDVAVQNANGRFLLELPGRKIGQKREGWTVLTWSAVSGRPLAIGGWTVVFQLQRQSSSLKVELFSDSMVSHLDFPRTAVAIAAREGVLVKAPTHINSSSRRRIDSFEVAELASFEGEIEFRILLEDTLGRWRLGARE